MKKITDKLFFELIHDYLMTYLTKQKCASPNTIRSYRMALNQFLDFICQHLQICMENISFEIINESVVSAYVDWLSKERECNNSTCNHHLSAVKSFFLYASRMEPVVVKYFHEIQKVPEKNIQKNSSVDYMTEKAVKAILKQPDTNTDKGLRDLFMMALLYDTGARISEILNMKTDDINIEDKPYAILLGKGSKKRTVPLMSSTVQQFKRYMDIFHKTEKGYLNEYLFYTTIHGVRNQLSDNAVRKIMKKYADTARTTCSEVPKNIYPHLWRHTRAMHLYQHGMDLTLISQWLGHASLETTLIYAHADTEMKRKAIEKANGNAVFAGIKSDNSRYTVSDETVLKKLYGLI